LYCFDPQTTAFGLCPTLFFAAIGTAVFVVGAFLGSFPIHFLGKLTALITAEDLGGMIGRKNPIAGLE
jgi:hypothetical protein